MTIDEALKLIMENPQILKSEKFWDKCEFYDILIVFFRHPDLIEFSGLFTDDLILFNDRIIYFDKDGLLPIEEDGTVCCDCFSIHQAEKLVDRFRNSFELTVYSFEENIIPSLSLQKLNKSPISYLSFDRGLIIQL